MREILYSEGGAGGNMILFDLLVDIQDRNDTDARVLDSVENNHGSPVMMEVSH